MLTSLAISNFALIEKLSIEFSSGFSVITGETGAGKSILLGALGLVLGKRADLTSLKNKEEKCVIEAHFQIAGYHLNDFFTANDLDYDDLTILRREILPSGKSRAFVNDSPVNLNELQELGMLLIDIHSQHQTQELSEEKIQFQIIDAIAANQTFLVAYATVLKAYKRDRSQLQDLLSQIQDAKKEQDYNLFLLNELSEANLQAGQQEMWETELEQLANVELIKENLSRSLALATEEQFGALNNLNEIRVALQKIAAFAPAYHDLYDRANSLTIELDDVVAELQSQTEKLSNDPERLELISQRLEVVYNLQKKHQVTTIPDLLEVQEGLESKVAKVDHLDDRIKSLENNIEKNNNVLSDLASEITKSRNVAIPVLTDQLQQYLLQLGMPNARFQIELETAETFHGNGRDNLKFLFSANKGSDFGLMKKVASGGEMSRIMLAVKAILSQAKNIQLPTIIFDEIDTGVSGEIANKMAAIMKQMSTTMQVFAITHLPQIAARGAMHFKVYKTVVNEQTQSELQLLTEAERVIEIAEMLSGKDASDSAINHAKALLN